MSSSQSKIDKAIAYHQQGQFAQAKAMYEEILLIEPNQADALHLLGAIMIAEKNFQRAVGLIEKAIAINPNVATFYSNRGIALQELKQPEAAVASYDRAITLNPNYAMAYSNRGLALQELKQFEAAIASYDRAIALNPANAMAYSNRGNALQEIKQMGKAIESFDRAISLKPDFVEAYVNRGNAYQELKQYEAAVVDFNKALTLKADVPYLLGMLIHTKMKLCDWSYFDENVSELIKRLERGEPVSSCYPLLALTNSLSLQKKTTEMFAQDKRPPNRILGDIPKHSASTKIRVGYFSADFRDHPLLFLLAEVFERHDKNCFEIIAFSYCPDTADALRQRAKNAFDQFIDVYHYSDKDVAQLARDMSIDIAVDLGGDTVHSRSSIFSYRAAPIQVIYLGWPGTMGTHYFDYVIADKTLIPKEYQPYFAEKIVYLPNSYQANDTKRKIADKKFSRAELGLPETGFIFCCFNDNHKITPSIFDSWMRILKAVPESVLFLYVSNKMAEINLRKEAVGRGVEPDRLIFGERLETSEYLARYRAADLFLNTFPYDAGTTASDALWAGLPVLTRMGETFVSRVAASLLHAIGLPELITTTQADYEALAIALATNPTQMNAIKEKLATHRLNTPLFNTTLFTAHLEEAYRQMVQRYQADLMPDHIYVE